MGRIWMIAVVCLLAWGMVVQAQPVAPCSAETVRGYYGFEYEGVVFMPLAPGGPPAPVPVTLVGTVSVDRGRFLPGGRFIMSTPMGSQAVPITMGQMEVAPDCTGTLVWRARFGGPDAPESAPAREQLMILDGGSKILSVMETGALGPAAITGTIFRLNSSGIPQGCRQAAYRGTYTAICRGYQTVSGIEMPLPIVGRVNATVRGDGSITAGNAFQVIGGVPVPATGQGGKVTVNEDCTGLVETLVQMPGMGTVKFTLPSVFTPDGKEIYAVSDDAAVSCRGHRVGN
jgi:hypothetical protein